MLEFRDWFRGSAGRLARLLIVPPNLSMASRCLPLQMLTGGGLQVIDVHTQTPVDLKRETNGDVMLVTTMRLDSAPPTDLTIGIACGPNCGAAVPIQPARLPVKIWRTVGIPLKCLAKTADMARIDTPFQLRTAQPFAVSIARVGLATVADDIVVCPR